MAGTSAALPFALPASQSDILRRRAGILTRLLLLDEGFAQVPVRSMRKDTLDAMLRLYDEVFLCGYLSRTYAELKITMSSRMTSAAGKFIYSRDAAKRLSGAEIRMSSDFLFRLKEGPFDLNGLTVSTAQEAFLVVFEHELCHAIETALYGSSGHSKRFLSIAFSLFGHTQIHHALPTVRSEAAQKGVFPGAKVSFLYQGKRLSGVVASVGKTAAVMVPSLMGAYRGRFGRRYDKYRVPIDHLTIEKGL